MSLLSLLSLKAARKFAYRISTFFNDKLIANNQKFLYAIFTMASSNSSNSLFPIFLLGFIDHVGLGLVYPLFSAVLFDPDNSLLNPETSTFIRGTLLGILIALTPLAQFFACPILGKLSDQMGRKPILIISISMGIAAYLIAAIGMIYGSLACLFIYRIVVGISDGSVAVAQAAIADISTEETKSRQFGLFNMYLGLGFTIGPFLGGKLSDPTLGSWFTYATPFWFAAFLCVLNLIWLLCRFKETLITFKKTQMARWEGLNNIRKAFFMPNLRILFLVMFTFSFGWSYFGEFVPLFLMDRFQFTPSYVGNFYAYMGICYSVSAGLIGHLILKKFSTHFVFKSSLILCGLYLFLFLLIESSYLIWFYVPALCCCLALIYPTAATLVSNSASQDSQGEILGVYQSVMSAAIALSPLVSGSLVAHYPSLSVTGSATIILSGGLIYAFQPRKLVEVGNQMLLQNIPR